MYNGGGEKGVSSEEKEEHSTVAARATRFHAPSCFVQKELALKEADENAIF